MDSHLRKLLPVVLTTVVLLTGLLGFGTSTAAAWSGSATSSPTTAYPGDVVDYKLYLKNTGDSVMQFNSATLTINWGSVTTTRSMTGITSLDPGETGTLACTFTVPQVAPSIYTVSIDISAKAVGDWITETHTATRSLTVQSIPSLEITVTASKNSGQTPLATTLSCSPTKGVAPYTYAWNFGDGGTSSQATVSHTYSNAGTYIATCQVTDAKGQKTSGSVTITVNAVPTLSVNVQATATSGQAPVSTTFSASPSGGSSGYTYSWTFGDGGTATGSSVSHEYKKSGTYTATCVVTDGSGQSASDSVTVTVSANSLDITDSASGISPILIAILVIVVIGVVAAVLVFAAKRRK